MFWGGRRKAQLTKIDRRRKHTHSFKRILGWQANTYEYNVGSVWFYVNHSHTIFCNSNVSPPRNIEQYHHSYRSTFWSIYEPFGTPQAVHYSLTAFSLFIAVPEDKTGQTVCRAPPWTLDTHRVTTAPLINLLFPDNKTMSLRSSKCRAYRVRCAVLFILPTRYTAPDHEASTPQQILELFLLQCSWRSG